MKTIIGLLFLIFIFVGCSSDDAPVTNYTSIEKITWDVPISNPRKWFRFYNQNIPRMDSIVYKSSNLGVISTHSYSYGDNGLLKSNRRPNDGRTYYFDYDIDNKIIRFEDSFDTGDGSIDNSHNYFYFNRDVIIDSILGNFTGDNHEPTLKGIVKYYLNEEHIIYKRVEDDIITDSIIYNSNSQPIKCYKNDGSYLEYVYYDNYKKQFFYSEGDNGFYVGDDINNYLLVHDFNIEKVMNRKGNPFLKKIIYSSGEEIVFDYEFSSFGLPSKLERTSQNGTAVYEYFYEE
ncbi:hypothetical protein [Aquimarina algiphila]|uniref:hypothetical protein n=1 Tax=Aquimarina algiphila TaxID=2047982 RepID=UPI00248FE17E|nr:hypothetical protein [Aquimarina algiphila]